MNTQPVLRMRIGFSRYLTKNCKILHWKCVLKKSKNFILFFPTKDVQATGEAPVLKREHLAPQNR